MNASRGSSVGLYHIQELKSSMKSGQETMCILRERADSLWEVLRNGIDQILRNSHGDTSFEELHKCGYMLVMHKHGEMLRGGLEERINDYLKYTLLENVSGSLDPQFLSALHSYFENHISSLEVIKGTLSYFDKVYVAHKGFDDVHTLGMKLFRSTILCNTVQTRVANMLLEMVRKERKKEENMDRPLVRKITGMLMELGINSRIVYREVFEDRFLEESGSFYMEESEELLNTDDFPEYITHFERRLSEEIERSEQCFDQSTTSEIVHVVENEFIRKNLLGLAGMSTRVVHVVGNRITDELARMHIWFSRVSEGLNAMCTAMSHYIREQGTTSDDRNNDPLVYVENMLTLKDKIDVYIEHALANDKKHRNTLIREFEDVLNANPRSPGCIAVYLDDKMKKSEKCKSDVSGMLGTLDKVMVLFTHLKEKDTFHEYYKNMLAARLLFTNVNEEDEKYITSKIKTECGQEFSRCFDGMLLDMERSANMGEEFRKRLSNLEDPTNGSSEGLVFSMRVLTPRHWPLHAEPTCKLPQNAQQALDSFCAFYTTRHEGRKLKLLPQRGSAEMTFRPNDSRTYTLLVQTLQMCVLTMFNERNSWVCEDLLKATEMPSQDLKRALIPLITMRKSSQGILVKKPNTPEIAETDSFFINASFHSKSLLVKIQSYGRAETERESDKTEMDLTTEEKFIEVKAAIVRIMKKERILNHDVLVDFVMTALSHRFCPTVIMIRNQIETLIETEYIARDYDDRRVYSYIS